MSCYYDKPQCTCGDSTNARCVDYEGKIGECSTIDTTQPYISIHQTTEELYTLVCDLKNAVDVTDIDKKCLDSQGSTSTLKDLLTAIVTKLCSLSTDVSEKVAPFTDCQLDMSGIVDPCGSTPTPSSQCEFNQLVLNLIKELKNG